MAKFCKTGTGAEDKVRGIERELIALNLLDEDPAHTVANDFRALADLLDSHLLSPADKVAKFRQAIEFYHGTLKAFETSIVKGKKGVRRREGE